MASLIHRFIGPQNPPPDFKDSDTYFEKLLKAVPADIVAAYITIQGILAEHKNQPLWLSWAVFLSFLFSFRHMFVMLKQSPQALWQTRVFTGLLLA